MTGPLKTLLDAVGSRLLILLAEELMLQANLTVQQASGYYLDLHGQLYGVQRLPGEPDGPVITSLAPAYLATGPTPTGIQSYRARILAAMTSPKCTPVGILGAVTTYLNSRGISAKSLNIDDGQLYSNVPAGTFYLTVFIPLRTENGMFLGREYLGRQSYLINMNGPYPITSYDPALIALVNSIKAAGTQPIYQFIRTLG